MNKEEFWSTQSRSARFEAIVFEHPAFDGPFRLVANQFADVELGGHMHTAVPMEVRLPSKSAGERATLTLSFPRAVVGREFKRQLRLVTADGSTAPIKVTYSEYLGDRDVPETTCEMFASDIGGVAFNGEAVQVTATVDNPMRRGVGVIYTPDKFTGISLF